MILPGACSKEEDHANDFRNEYVGKYAVTESINCYGPCGQCSSENDTVIEVRYGLTDSTIIVLGREVCLDSLGSYYAYHYGLRIWNDSISSFFMNGGLGCGQYVVHEGVRIGN